MKKGARPILELLMIGKKNQKKPDRPRGSTLGFHPDPGFSLGASVALLCVAGPMPRAVMEGEVAFDFAYL